MTLNSKDFWKGLVKGDRSLMGFEPFETRFSESEIIELGKKLSWKGIGTVDDPIIIPNEQGLPQIFSISVKELHIKIVDCKFDHLVLYNCKSIIIDNSSFKILGVFKSSKISVEYCDISNLDLEKCSNSYFKSCSIQTAGNLRSQGNVFEDCQITPKVKKRLLEGLFELPKNLRYWPILMAIYSFGIVFFAAIYIINSLPFGLYWYLSVILFVALIIIFGNLSRIQKKNIPNKIISNQNLDKNYEKGV